MKIRLIIGALLLDCAGVHAQDAPFQFQSPFGSDGTNQTGLDPAARNTLVLDHVWDAYVEARKSLDQPLPREQPGGYTQAQIDLWIATARYGQLLETMAELRAFTTQNKGYTDQAQRDEIARIDSALRALDLHYGPRGGQAMDDFCAKAGTEQVRRKLTPLLCNDDGSPRPIPPEEFGFHQTKTGIQR
jgi:hypothetical protein